MFCQHFDAGRCMSCSLMPVPYAQQVAEKARRVREVLAPFVDSSAHDDTAVWLPPATSAESGFRTKAKMVVTGSAAAPVLGLASGVDLTDCPLYPPALTAVFGPMTEFITLARLQPYDLSPGRRRVTPQSAAARGELKYVIVTLAPSGEVMIRLVVRSTATIARMRKHLPWLIAALPNLAVCSVNIQPEHKAVLEGAEEIVLTERQTLPVTLPAPAVPGLDRLSSLSRHDRRNQGPAMTLQLHPGSFVQTNTDIAAQLYTQAREWVDDLAPESIWDLYCGAGGFALACAAPGRRVTGVDVTSFGGTDPAQDVRVRFVTADATAFAQAADPDDYPGLVILNPPRRGIGTVLARWLDASGISHVLYSSCNADSLARDLAAMPSFRIAQARLFDMFPHTEHHEVLTLLTKNDKVSTMKR